MILALAHALSGLRRFAAFFSCPLLSVEGTDREIHAVDSEHNKNLQDDERREYQLLRCTCDPDHPMARFGSGSYKTLHDEPAGLFPRTLTLTVCPDPDRLPPTLTLTLTLALSRTRVGPAR